MAPLALVQRGGGEVLTPLGRDSISYEEYASGNRTQGATKKPGRPSRLDSIGRSAEELGVAEVPASLRPASIHVRAPVRAEHGLPRVRPAPDPRVARSGASTKDAVTGIASVVTSAAVIVVAVFPILATLRLSIPGHSASARPPPC